MENQTAVNLLLDETSRLRTTRNRHNIMVEAINSLVSCINKADEELKRYKAENEKLRQELTRLKESEIADVEFEDEAA